MSERRHDDDLTALLLYCAAQRAKHAAQEAELEKLIQAAQAAIMPASGDANFVDSVAAERMVVNSPGQSEQTLGMHVRASLYTSMLGEGVHAMHTACLMSISQLS